MVTFELRVTRECFTEYSFEAQRVSMPDLRAADKGREKLIIKDVVMGDTHNTKARYTVGILDS